VSRSYRTQKEEVIAKRNISRDSKDKLVLPRVIERKPREGDIHPISKSRVESVLAKTPDAYLYGLSRIELRARNAPIG
jgi:hypothetical protein